MAVTLSHELPNPLVIVNAKGEFVEVRHPDGAVVEDVMIFCGAPFPPLENFSEYLSRPTRKNRLTESLDGQLA